MKAWELEAAGATPLVTYRCVESGRGTLLAATFTGDGRPVFAWWADADTAGSASVRWFGFVALDESGDLVEGYPDLVPLHCHWHGYWMVPRSVMLEQWADARRTKPVKVNLDEKNPWFRATAR